MTTARHSAASPFAWNAGGWFGAQLGSSLWMFILGLVLLRTDPVAASVDLACFVLLNAWGLHLWRSRDRVSAYAGSQRFLIGATVLITLIALVSNARGISAPQAPGAWDPMRVPYWAIALGPILMLQFWLQERAFRRRGS
jgi:hypothetical protein